MTALATALLLSSRSPRSGAPRTSSSRSRVRDFSPAVDDRAPARCSRGAPARRFLVARRGRREALAERPRGWRGRARDRDRQRRDPVHADRLGREAHRLGRRRDRERVGADLQRAARARGCCPSERSTGARLVGVALGLVGVGVLAGVQPAWRRWVVVGTLAVVLASVSYAFGGLYAPARLATAPGPVLATASMLGGALVAAAVRALPAADHAPGWKPVASLARRSTLARARRSRSSSSTGCSRSYGAARSESSSRT